MATLKNNLHSMQVKSNALPAQSYRTEGIYTSLSQPLKLLENHLRLSSVAKKLNKFWNCDFLTHRNLSVTTGGIKSENLLQSYALINSSLFKSNSKSYGTDMLLNAVVVGYKLKRENKNLFTVHLMQGVLAGM